VQGALSNYFTPYSPMLYNIKTGYNGMRQTPMAQIVILVSSLHKVAADGLPFVFTDRHAYLQAAEFKTELKDLDVIDWQILANRDFRGDPNDPGKMERYQAEALVHGCVRVSTLLGLACYDSQAEARSSGRLSSTDISLKVAVKPDWYF
jgi:ssDNA thymidine ADP-ribosyltransferase, DarT